MRIITLNCQESHIHIGIKTICEGIESGLCPSTSILETILRWVNKRLDVECTLSSSHPKLR